MIKIAVCDDDRKVLDGIVNVIEETYKNEVYIIRYDNPVNLIEDWQESLKNQTDIVILDICFREENGIATAQKLQQINRNVKIIFITAYIEYASEIFEAQPFYFLVKPVDKQKIAEVVRSAMKAVKNEDIRSLIIQTRDRIEKVRVDDIWYVESIKRNIVVHEVDRQISLIKKLDEVEKMLPDYFLRCHKSFLVNADKIKRMESREFVLLNDIRIPISRTRHSEIKNRFLLILGRLLG